jgi:hypothetical protein
VTIPLEALLDHQAADGLPVRLPTEGIGGDVMVARGARCCNFTKAYTVAAAAVATIINNNGADTASRMINWLNQVAAGKGVNTCIRTTATTTTIT